MLRDLSSSLKTRLRTLRGDVIVRLDLNSLADSLDSELIEHDDSAGQAIFAESDRISNETADEALRRLIPKTQELLKEGRKYRRRFERELLETWSSALDTFELMRTLAMEFGDALDRRLRPEAAKQSDYVFECLTRLHGRACLTAGEVETLLRGGYASGATSRWRTLHELAVIAFFIEQEGQGVAERYLDHQRIEAFLVAKRYQEHCEALKEEPLTERDLKELQH